MVRVDQVRLGGDHLRHVVGRGRVVLQVEVKLGAPQAVAGGARRVGGERVLEGEHDNWATAQSREGCEELVPVGREPGAGAGREHEVAAGDPQRLAVDLPHECGHATRGTEFQALVKRTHAERHARGFTCWGQFVAMLFCHLGRAQSLREICGGLAASEGMAHEADAVARASLLVAFVVGRWHRYAKSGFKLVGDVNYDEVSPKCSYITPVPGGVGPMTIASLLKNTLLAAKKEIYK